MAEVLEQINKMTREEKIRLAHLLLDAIEHGTVIKPTAPSGKNDFSCFFGKTNLKGDPVKIQRAMRDEW